MPLLELGGGGGGGIVFKVRAYSGQLTFWLVETILSFYFLETPASDFFFPSGGNDVSRKSFILASGNGC